MGTVLEHRNTIRHAHLCAVVSSLTVGKENHPQCSSRVNQQITMHLSHLRDASGPSLWNGQSKSLLQTPARGGKPTPAPWVSGTTLLACPASAVGYHPGSPRVYSQVATPFSITAITHSVTVLTNHLVLGQQQWPEPDRKHWGCWLPVTTPPKTQSVYLSLFLIFCHYNFLHIQ